MTRAQAIATVLRRGYRASATKDIRRWFNTAKKDRTAKWFYSTPHLFAVALPSMREVPFKEMARAAELGRSFASPVDMGVG